MGDHELAGIGIASLVFFGFIFAPIGLFVLIGEIRRRESFGRISMLTTSVGIASLVVAYIISAWETASISSAVIYLSFGFVGLGNFFIGYIFAIVQPQSRSGFVIMIAGLICLAVAVLVAA